MLATSSIFGPVERCVVAVALSGALGAVTIVLPAMTKVSGLSVRIDHVAVRQDDLPVEAAARLRALSTRALTVVRSGQFMHVLQPR